MDISRAQEFEYTLEEIRAAGSCVVDGVYAASDAIRRANGDIDERRQALERLIELEQRKVVALYGASTAEIRDLALWDLDDRADPTGDMRLIGRAMGRSPDENWSPARVADQLGRMRKALPEKRLRNLMRRMRDLGVLESPRWGEYRLKGVASSKRSKPGGAKKRTS